MTDPQRSRLAAIQVLSDANLPDVIAVRMVGIVVALGMMPRDVAIPLADEMIRACTAALNQSWSDSLHVATGAAA